MLDLAKGEQRLWLRLLARTGSLKVQVLGACGCRECTDPFNSEAYLATCVSCGVRVVRTKECEHKLMFTEFPLRCSIQG